MATTEVFYDGDGSDVTFDIPFEYLEESDVKVSVGGTLKTQDTDYTFSTLTEITFTTAPPSGTANVRIFRDTDINSLRNEFFAGSAIRAQDLNDDFLQTLYTVQEIEDQFVTQTNGSFDTNVDMNSNRITELADPVDAQDAVTKQYLEDNYFDDGTETILSNETWPDNDTTIATTASIDNRIDSKIDTAITNDIGADSSGITVTDDGDGTITLGLSANSIDLDRLKDADIITSAESNPNNDTTIATTAKIDDMIDAAITGDIATDNTGITVTDDGDGTITLGLANIDLDRIKADDIITYAEQNAGPTTDDDSIFTSSAASRRFDTLVQTGTPSGSDWETGKTWLQNDDDQTLKIWNGSTWLDVASGGSFRTQDKVIYVDSTGGDDSKTGHRISGPKLTIKAAINDINADIDTSIKTAGSGYTDGSYTNVPLTGGTSGSGLQANITVSSGAVTACTVTSTTTLEDYQIGDILSAADSNLGGGGGSGFELEVTGDGDGMTVIVSAGTYQEAAPIQIKRRNVSIIGMALRSTIVHPTVATQGDHADGNNALFELNSGSFLQNLTLTGMKAGTYSSGDPNTLDSDLPKRQGWNFAFYNNAVITKSPYIQNCTNFSDSQIDNSDLNAHNPAGGQGGDLTNAPTGGGLLVDGSVPNSASPLRSMVCDSYTHVGLNGPGILVTNNGYLQATSSYAFFNKYHIKARNGGQANLAASTTDFGEKALVADGKSTSAIFTASVNGAKTSGSETFDIDGITAGSGWFGDANIPATNMLVTVNSVTYPILEATAITGGYRVKISRPNASNRSVNDGLNGDIADNAAVSFFLRSQIASSGHTMEYVGSGMDYDALPENGGVPDETKQITELNNGKIWTAITDHNGKFKIGGNQTDDPIFEVDQQLGFITIPTGSIAFDLLSDTTPQLGGNLDVQARTITTSTTNGNITLDPNGTGVVDVSTSRITNVTDPTGAQDAATKNYVDTQIGGIDEVVEDLTPQLGGNLDVNGQTITSASNGNIVIDPNGTGTISLGADTSVTGDLTVDTDTLFVDAANNRVGVGTTSPQTQFVVSNGGAQGLEVGWDGSTSQYLQAYNRSGSAWIPIRIQGSDIRFNISGSSNEKMRIDSSGRVGIGTSSPSYLLDVKQNIATPVCHIETNSTGNNVLLSLDGASGFASGGGARMRFGRATQGANSVEAGYDHDSTGFQITKNGSALLTANSTGVGIGTTTVNQKLHLYDTSSNVYLRAAVGAYTGVDYGAAGDGNGVINVRDNAALQILTNGTERARIDSSGRLLVGKTSASGTALLQIEGGVSSVERTITASAFDLGTGNFWTCGAIAIPNPTNGVAGMSGLIRVTAAPTSFGSNWDFPGGSYTAPTAFPAVAPFYIVSSTQFYLGNWTEGIA